MILGDALRLTSDSRLLSSQRMFLMHLMNLIEKTDGDSVTISGVELSKICDVTQRNIQLCTSKLNKKGFIFVQHNKTKRGLNAASSYKVVGFRGVV